MKRKIFRCLLCAFYLTTTVFPVAVLLAGLAEGSVLPAMLAFALAAVSGSVLSVFVKERRAIWTIAVIAAACAGSVLLLPYDGWNYVCAIGCGVIVPVGVCRDREENALIDVRLMIAGLFCAGLSYFIAMLNLIDWVKPVIGYGAYVYLMLSLLLLNRGAVRQAAGGQARRMMRGNQGLTLVFAVVMTIVVFIAPLQHAVANGLRWLIASFFNLFAGGNASDDIVSGGEQAGQMDLSALGGEERVMPEWLQTLSTIVLTVVAVAAVLALLVLMVRQIVRWLKTLWNWLAELWQKWNGNGGSTEEYADQSEQMMTAQSMGKQLMDEWRARVQKRLRPAPRWSALTPRQRVRTVYGHILNREVKIRPDAVAQTPQELCGSTQHDEAFAALYDRARYSDETVTEQEAERFRAYLKQS